MKGHWMDPVKHLVHLELTTQHEVQWHVAVVTGHCIHIHTLGRGTK